MTELWEILVPAADNEGRGFPVDHHREWDARVRAISGGLTIMPAARGEWVGPEGTTFREKMIPVRMACTEQQAIAIADMTAEYYDQKAVMVYRVSSKCIIRERTK